MVLVFGLHDVEEAVAIEPDVAHRDMRGIGHRRVLAAFQIEELLPRTHEKKRTGIAFYIFDGDVFVVLRRVGAHLEPQQARCVAHLAAAQHDVAVVDRFAAAGQRTVAEAEFAIFDDDVEVSSVRRVLVGPRAFAAFEGDGVIVYRHVAAAYVHVAAYVDVERIRTRSLDRCRGGVNLQPEQPHAFRIVDVGRPERRVAQRDALQLHVLRIGDVDQPRAQFVHVGALRDDLAAQPERTPETLAVAVDRPLAREGESVCMIGVDECCEIGQRLAFDAGVDDREVRDVVAPFQYTALRDMQMGARFEEE